MVDDQVHGGLRIDPRGVAPHPGQRGPHGSQIHERGNSGEVLQDDAGRAERNLAPGRRLGVPGREGGHVLFANRSSVHPAEQRLEKDPHGERKPGNGPESFTLDRLEGVDVHVPAAVRCFSRDPKELCNIGRREGR